MTVRACDVRPPFQSPVTRVETKKAAPTVFGDQDAIAQRSSPELASNRATVKPLRRLPPRHLRQVETRPHPSPSARPFRLLPNDLATSALRRMFLQLTPPKGRAGSALSR